MNTGRQAMWLFITIITLACSGWYFASTKSQVKLDKQTLSTTPDAIIKDLTVKKFNANGQLVNYLTSPLMQHTPTNNTHTLQTPVVMVIQDNQPPWEIRSQEAISLYGGEEITFSKKVIIHQQPSDKTAESTLKTETITYFANEKIAKTTADVQFEQPGSIILSKGMNAYLAEKRVQLLHRARGTYEPKHG